MDEVDAVGPFSKSLSLRIESTDILAKMPITPPVILSDLMFSS